MSSNIDTEINKDDLRNEFEELRKKLTKKCGICKYALMDKENDIEFCEGWSMSKCIWECRDDSDGLVKRANEISDKLALTEEEINNITNALKNNISEENKTLRSIISNPTPSDEGVKSEIVELSINPDTGKISGTKPFIEDQSNIEDIILGKVQSKSYTEETINQIADTYSITKADARSVVKLIKDVKNNKCDKIYDKLPLGLRQVADGIYDGTGSIEDVCKDLIMQFESDLDMNQQFIDLQKSIDSSYKEAFSSLGILTYVNTRELYETTLIEKAEEYKETDTDLYNKLLLASKAYKDSYTFQIQLKYLMNIQKKNKRKINDISKFNSVINHFNERYRDNTKNIKDIRMIVPILYRRLGISDELLKKFVILSCLSFEKMSPENINEHIYMFYTVQNLAGMDFIKEGDEGYEFASEIANNLISVLSILEDMGKNIKKIYLDPNDNMYKIEQSNKNKFKKE